MYNFDQQNRNNFSKPSKTILLVNCDCFWMTTFHFQRKYQIFSKLHCWNVASHKLRLKFSQETGNEENAFVVWVETDRCHYSIWNKIILGLSENHSLVNFTRKASWPHQIWHFQKRWSSVAKFIWYNLVHKLSQIWTN